jgi:hypothetical protein
MDNFYWKYKKYKSLYKKNKYNSIGGSDDRKRKSYPYDPYDDDDYLLYEAVRKSGALDNDKELYEAVRKTVNPNTTFGYTREGWSVQSEIEGKVAKLKKMREAARLPSSELEHPTSPEQASSRKRARTQAQQQANANLREMVLRPTMSKIVEQHNQAEEMMTE